MHDSSTLLPTRRKFLATIAAFALTACHERKPNRHAVADALGDYFWSGIGFGIEMSMELHGMSCMIGEKLAVECERIIHDMEQSFSLYQEDSELSVLNRERILKNPTPLFCELLNLSIIMNQRTLGYYHPAIHGAWLWLEAHGPAEGLDQNPDWVAQCRACDLKFLEIGPSSSIRLTHPLTQLSMNAIAQGFLADTVAAHLRSAAVTTAMLHLGESYAIGKHPEGRSWNLAIMGTAVNGESDLIGNVNFSDAGLAVSAQDSTRILIDPVADTVRRRACVAAVVSSEGAAVADAYATAFAVAPEAQWSRLALTLKQAPGSQVRVWVDNTLEYENAG